MANHLGIDTLKAEAGTDRRNGDSDRRPWLTFI